MWSRIIPILMLLCISLVVLALVLYQRKKAHMIEAKERLAAEERWTGMCQFDNPKTGAKCQREEFHLTNHYRELPDRSLVTWP